MLFTKNRESLTNLSVISNNKGDAVMAVFGVPFAHNDDAIHACNAALKMREALRIWNIERVSQSQQELSIGIGINTGMVLSGNIGSTKRMEFSCIGDSVNLASRTEGLTKFFKVTILITEHTLKDTNDEFITREIDRVIVTGKKTSVKMYELIGRKGDPIPINVKEALEYYEKGLELYRKREYQQACINFEKGILYGNDGASKVLLCRAKNYIQNPPDSNWNGDFIASEK